MSTLHASAGVLLASETAIAVVTGAAQSLPSADWSLIGSASLSLSTVEVFTCSDTSAPLPTFPKQRRYHYTDNVAFTAAATGPAGSVFFLTGEGKCYILARKDGIVETLYLPDYEGFVVSAYCDTQYFVLIGSSDAASSLLVSDDARNWRLLARGPGLSKVAANDRHIIVIGDNGIFTLSRNGVRQAFTPIPDGRVPGTIAVANNRFFVFLTPRKCYVSYDGQRWALQDVPIVSPTGLAHYRGTYVLTDSNECYVSNNGVFWEQIVAPPLLSGGIIHDGSRFLQWGRYGGISSSYDGRTWDLIYSGYGPAVMQLLYDGQRYFRVFDATEGVESANDATQFVPENILPPLIIAPVALTATGVIASTKTTIYRYFSGLTEEIFQAPDNTWITSVGATDGGSVIACVLVDQYDQYSARISLDSGMSWTSLPTYSKREVFSDGDRVFLLEVPFHGQGAFIVADPLGGIFGPSYYWPLGTNLPVIENAIAVCSSSGSTYFFGQKVFVAVSPSNVVTITEHPTALRGRVHSAAYKNGVAVLAGYNGILAVKIDNGDWSLISLNVRTATKLSVVFTETHVAVFADAPKAVFIAPIATPTVFARIDLPQTFPEISRVSYRDGYFYAVGSVADRVTKFRLVSSDFLGAESVHIFAIPATVDGRVSVGALSIAEAVDAPGGIDLPEVELVNASVYPRKLTLLSASNTMNVADSRLGNFGATITSGGRSTTAFMTPGPATQTT